MELTIEIKLIGIWILNFLAMAIHHLWINDIIRDEIKKLKDEIKKLEERLKK